MNEFLDENEIALDLAATSAAAAARASFFAPAGGVRWRDVQVVAAAPNGTNTTGGSALIARRALDRQRRYERIISEEGRAPGTIDYKLQIGCACMVLEEEVTDLLAEPLRPVSRALAAAVRGDATTEAQRTAELLEKWGAGREPTTLGLVTRGLLVAVRRALDRAPAAVAAALEAAFAPELRADLRANRLGPVLDRLRNDRNAACHAHGSFDAPAYRTFTERLVGAPSLSAWERSGPTPNPPPASAGFLHRLLSGSRLLAPVELPPAGAAVDALTRLAAPRAGAFAVELVPDAPHLGTGGFRLGNKLVVRVRAERACHVALIDVGTTGALALLLPNALCPRPVLEAGAAAHFPGPGFADFALVLHGATGRERMVLVACVDALPALPVPPPGGTFAALAAPDVERFAAAVRARPADRWSAAACEFEITA